MNNSNKQKLINSSLYIALALIAIAIVSITIFSLATSANKKGESKITETEPIEEKDSETEKSSEKENITSSELNEKDTDKDVSADTDNASAASADSLKFCLPVSTEHISKGYDCDTAVYSLTMNDYRVHDGIDFAASVGSPVYACADGTVCDIYDSLFMGTCIVIDHGYGIKSYYMNVSEEIPDGIYEGASVSGGQTIAGVGETSVTECADVPHLHFEMKLDGVTTDPCDYLDISTLTSVGADTEYED